MNCELWQDKLDAFVDLELSTTEQREFEAHLRGCPACSGETVARQRLKSQTRFAGHRFVPSPEFERRMRPAVAKKNAPWNWLPVVAAAAVALLFAAGIAVWKQRAQASELVSQLVDQHVATMASANPADVLSTDSHTVKPWFQGKVPFSVDIPNLDGTQFTLFGGRLSYVQQSPTAQLIFAVRQHRISVFIARETSATAALGEDSNPKRRFGFNTQTWTEDGMRFFAISDVNPADLHALCARLRKES